MMTTGFGFNAITDAPAGVGTPVANLALVAPGEQKSTTGCVSSIEIDPLTRDYAYDSHGNEEAMADIDQRVYFLVKTTLYSRRDYETGLKLPSHITETINADIEAMLRNALDPVIVDSSASLDSVEIVVTGTTVLCVARWTDLTTNEQRETAVPLKQ